MENVIVVATAILVFVVTSTVVAVVSPMILLYWTVALLSSD